MADDEWQIHESHPGDAPLQIEVSEPALKVSFGTGEYTGEDAEVGITFPLVMVTATGFTRGEAAMPIDFTMIVDPATAESLAKSLIVQAYLSQSAL